MSLTYQPFAKVPAVEKLSHDLQMNLPDKERVFSGALGLGLIASGLARGGIGRWVLLLAGGALLRRGMTGHCPLYQQIDLDRRHPRPGVPGNRGTRVEAAVEIGCRADALFAFWRNLEQLPQVMRHVKSVKPSGSKRSHWQVVGPAGQTVEWDAEVINEIENRLIAWQSLPGSTVRNAGSVWFEPTPNHTTRVKVAFEFDPPAGAFGTALAEFLGSSPQADLAEDLERFKGFAENGFKTELATK